MNLLWRIDDMILNGLDAAVVWCIEWFSWSRKWIERVLIGACAVTDYVNLSIMPPSMPGWAAVLFLLPLLVTLVSLHASTPRQRGLRRHDTTLCVARVGYVVLGILVTALVICTHSWSRTHAWDTASGLTGILTFDMVALGNEGDPGKRRKIALTKLKELFGSSWIPEPLPEAR